MRDQILTFARKRRPGYLDLANDLISVAEFYEVPEVKDLISRDPMPRHRPAACSGSRATAISQLGAVDRGRGCTLD